MRFCEAGKKKRNLKRLSWVSAAVIKTQEAASLLLRSTFSQIRTKKNHLEFEVSGNTSPHNPLLSPVSPREPPPFRSIASGLELNKRGRRNSNIEFYRNAGGLCPESDQRICRGGRRERKRARGNERSAGENNRQSLFIFHLVPVSLLFNNFPYVRFTLTTKKNFPNVTFIRRVLPSRGHDFSANARPLTCHSRILFFLPDGGNDRFSVDGDRKMTTVRSAAPLEATLERSAFTAESVKC